MLRETLSHYRILEKLGQGGMGEVYRARDTKLDREVALKVLPEDFARDAERRKRFEREAKAVAALKHPNIVTIHSVEEVDGVHFLTMELVEGQSLSDIIPAGGLDLKRFFEIAIPLTDAVSSAHAKGIAHRDLKPSNVMFDADGRLKILDFGLAKLFESAVDADKTVGADSDTDEGRILGTAAYMSPEQAEGGTIDHRSDVFSLGIMFYEMATGERPFKGKTSISTLSSILRDTPPTLSDIKPLLPRHLGRIVRRCLEKDPERRYQTVLDLRNDLRDLSEEGAAEASGDLERPSGKERATPAVPTGSVPRKFFKFMLAAALVAIAVIAVMVTRAPDRTVDPGSRVKRLAVLPFENLGATEDEYFADGITDEITAKLAGMHGLAVISRASAKKYKHTDKELHVIGDELGVDYILEGTIRWDKSGGRERVRITPQLIDVSEDVHVWAENYEREINEIFAVQADIAKQIAGALDVTFSTGPASGEEPPTDNVAAYQAYLRSLDYDAEELHDFKLRIELLTRATELDPTFALAWAALSIGHSAMHHYGHDQTDQRLEWAKDALDRAMALDPDLPEAYLALAYYHYWGHRDYGRALEALDVAETMIPNDPRLLEVKSYVLRRQGNVKEALDYMQRAAELDPQNISLARDIGLTLTLLRRYDEAIEFYGRAVAIAPDIAQTYTLCAQTYVLKGDAEGAKAVLKKAPKRQDPEFQVALLMTGFVLGDYDAMIEAGSDKPDEVLLEQRHVMIFGYWVGRAYEQKGEKGRALALYEIARVRLETERANRPDDHRVHSALGLVYASLGRKGEAIAAGQRGTELMPVTRDILLGADRIADMTKIYALVGEANLALDNIEYLLKVPASFSVALVRMDPTYDSLRDQTRYTEILERYGERLP